MSGCARFFAAWNRFWFAEGSPVALALFRIAFAVVLFVEVPVSERMSGGGLGPGFHLPYLAWLPIPSPELFRLLHLLQYPFIVLLGVGLFTRSACAALLGLQAYVFFLDVLTFRNHPYFFLLVLGILMFSPAAQALSIDRVLRRPKGPRRPSSLTAQRLLQVQICVVYVFAGLQKINLDYLDGSVLGRLLENVLTRGDTSRLFEAAIGEPATAAAAAWIGDPSNALVPSLITVALELVLPVALWIPRARPFAIPIGVVFHVVIGVSMLIVTFSVAMIASYLLFLDPEGVERWVSSGIGGTWRRIDPRRRSPIR